LALDGLQNFFSMGAASYGTSNTLLEVDTQDNTNVNGWDFAKPYSMGRFLAIYDLWCTDKRMGVLCVFTLSSEGW